MAERFTLLSELGRGGMGVVWRARDQETGQIVALKALHPAFATDPNYVARFERELELAKRINSPHVVRVVGFGVHESSPYLALEFVDGSSLRDMLAEHGPYSWPEVRSLLEQIAQGLADAHAAGVIHRDMKPSNVLVTKDGCAKIADFGIAMGLDLTRVTGTSTMIGTPAYLPPEGPNDERSDLYSLGIIAYELLSGAPPFVGRTYQEVILRHIRDVPDLSRIPAEARVIVGRLLAKDPNVRPRSATDLIRMLRGEQPATPALMTPPPTPRKPPTPPPTTPKTPRLPRPLRRSSAWAMIGAGVLVLVVVAAALGAIAVQPRPGPTPTDTMAARSALAAVIVNPSADATPTPALDAAAQSPTDSPSPTASGAPSRQAAALSARPTRTSTSGVTPAPATAKPQPIVTPPPATPPPTDAPTPTPAPTPVPTPTPIPFYNITGRVGFPLGYTLTHVEACKPPTGSGCVGTYGGPVASTHSYQLQVPPGTWALAFDDGQGDYWWACSTGLTTASNYQCAMAISVTDTDLYFDWPA